MNKEIKKRNFTLIFFLSVAMIELYLVLIFGYIAIMISVIGFGFMIYLLNKKDMLYEIPKDN